MNKSLLSLALAAFTLGGCSLIPDYQQPPTSVAAQWPQGPAYGPNAAAEQAASEQGWRQFFRDPALQQLIQTALQNNLDLRVAALNIDAYRAQYRIQRAELLPAVSADGSGSRQRLPGELSSTGSPQISSQYSATLGVSAYELDLFGRVRSLSEQALETYLSSEEARRATQISLVADVANAYLTWQADKELLKVTQDTLATFEESYRLTARSNEVGVASALDLSQSRTSVENAKVQLAKYTRQVAQDENGLTLLLGTGVPSNLTAARPLADDLLIRGMGGSDVHWGLVIGVVVCLLAGLWLRLTPSGFAVRVVGGNPRAAQLVGLPATRLIVVACALGGAAAGLAGAIEVAAVHTSANAALIAGYGYAGIVVAALARNNLGLIIVSGILFSGLRVGGNNLQVTTDTPIHIGVMLQGAILLFALGGEAFRRYHIHVVRVHDVSTKKVAV